MYVLHEILLLLLAWLAKRPALRNALAVTAVLLAVTVAGRLVSWLVSDAPVRFAVSGSVRLGGAPLDAGTIEFRPPAGAVAGSVAGAAIRAGRYSIPAQRGLTAADYDVRIYSAVLPPQPTDGGRSGDVAPGRGLPPGVEQIPVEYGSETKQRVRVGRWLRNVFDFDMPLRSAPPAPGPPTAGPPTTGPKPRS